MREMNTLYKDFHPTDLEPRLFNIKLSCNARTDAIFRFTLMRPEGGIVFDWVFPGSSIFKWRASLGGEIAALRGHKLIATVSAPDGFILTDEMIRFNVTAFEFDEITP